MGLDLAVFRIDRFGATEAAANAVRGRIKAMFRSKRRAGLPDGRAAVRLIERLLIVAIGAILAWNSWLGLGPYDAPAAAPPPRAAPVEQAVHAGPNNPFRSAAAPEAAPTGDAGADVAETTLNLTLHGTWIDGSGGAAIIQIADQKQGRFVPGDTITSGVTLERVLRDQVILLRNGVRESLRMINRDASTPSGGAAAAGEPQQVDLDGMATIGNFVVARPQPDAIGNLTLVLHPAGEIDGFEALGLEVGDKLVAVDNQPIGPDIALGLETLAMTQGGASVTISIERQGVVMPFTIALPNAPGRIE